MRHFKKSLIKNNKWTKTCKALKDLLDILCCSKCKKSLHDPQQFLSCGHFSCFSCINNDSSSCIQCQLSYKSEDVVIDDTIDKIVQACCIIAKEVGYKPNNETIQTRLVETPTSDEIENSSEEFATSRNTETKPNQSQINPTLEKRKRHINSTRNKNAKKAKIEKPSLNLRIPKNINKTNHHGETKLQEECRKNHKQYVKILLNNGADPNIPCAAKWTPLQESADFGYHEIAEILLQAKADVNQLGHQDRTALHEAAKNNDAKMVELLLKYGANRNVYDQEGKKPIDYCELEEVKKLFYCDSKKCPSIKKEGSTVDSQYCHEASSSSKNISSSQDNQKKPNVEDCSQESEEHNDSKYYFERNSNNFTISHSQKLVNDKASCSQMIVDLTKSDSAESSDDEEITNNHAESEEVIDVIN